MSTYYEVDESQEWDLYQGMALLVRKNPWAWQSIGAVLGLVGGILSPVLGTLLIAVMWFIGSQEEISVLNVFSIVSFVLTIPLLAEGAHCLDLLERKTAELSAHDEQSADKNTTTNSSLRGAGLEDGHRLKVTCAAKAAALLFTLPVSGHAQQTIFNVPSSDVLDKGKVYGELDVTFKTNDDPGNVAPRFSSFVPRVVVGAGRRVEIGVNITGNTNPGPDSTTFVPAIKYKAYDGGDNGWAIVLGDNVFIPVRHKSYDIGNYIYAQTSKTFSTKARVTFGGYHFSDNVVAAGAQRAGGQFGFEQPITSKVGFAADWYTGKQAAGYFTPGFNFKPHPKATGYVGYSIGNTNLSNGNHFFYTAIGINFN